MKLEGIGLGVRSAFAEELLESERRPDWLELIPENWMFYGGKHRRTLHALRERFPLVPHSVSLDIGGLGPLDDTFLTELAKFVADVDAPFFSDHICWSSAHGRPLHDLLPLPFSRASVESVAKRSKEAVARVGRPLVLENATFYAHLPTPEGEPPMTESMFLQACAKEAGVKLLLDVNNIYVNSKNHDFDARAFIDSVPMELVEYFHLAGHTHQADGVIIDTHIGPIIDDVWSLYGYALKRAGRLVPTLIEWDQEIPALPVLLDEVDRARAEAKAALAGSAS